MALALYWATSCGLWDKKQKQIPLLRSDMSFFKRGLLFLRKAAQLLIDNPIMRDILKTGGWRGVFR